MFNLLLNRLLGGRSFPNNFLQNQQSDHLSEYDTSLCSPSIAKCHSYNDLGLSEPIHSSSEVILTEPMYADYFLM